MTLHRQYPLPAYATDENVDDHDEELDSPSDGYFGGRGGQVPTDVFVPTSQEVTKAQEAASDHAGSSRSGGSHRGTYTPQTTGMTPASSRRDSGSQYNPNPYTNRSNLPEVVQEEDAPPEYSETVPSQSPPEAREYGSQSRYRDYPQAEVSISSSSHAMVEEHPYPSPLRPEAQPLLAYEEQTLPLHNKRCAWKNANWLPTQFGGKKRKEKRHCWSQWSRKRERQRKRKPLLFVFVIVILLMWPVIRLIQSFWVQMPVSSVCKQMHPLTIHVHHTYHDISVLLQNSTDICFSL